MLKRSAPVHNALSATDMLGYKTRIALGLLIALVLCKLIQATIILGSRSAVSLGAWLSIKAGSPLQRKLTPEQESNKLFFTALVLGTVVGKDGAVFDKWDAERANVGLALASGVVLLLASICPGDGLRVYEFIAGLLLVASGLIQGAAREKLQLEAVANAAGQFIAAHNVQENKEILAAVAPLLPIVMQHINPAAVGNDPVQIVTEIAEKAAAK